MALYLVDHPEIIMLALLPIALAFMLLFRKAGNLVSSVFNAFSEKVIMPIAVGIGRIIGNMIVASRRLKSIRLESAGAILMFILILARFLLVPLVVIALIILIF